MREFFETEMSADAAHRERWRKGLTEAEQERITEPLRGDARRGSSAEGYHCAPGAAPLLRAQLTLGRPTGPSRTPRILFTTSNGTGLGHLTRSMAIARRLARRVEPLFLTLSAAAPVVERMGFPVEYVASYATPARGNDYRWSRRLRGAPAGGDRRGRPGGDRLRRHPPLRGAARRAAAPTRRGLVPAAAVEARARAGCRCGRAGAFDAVLEPGELAAVRGPRPDGRASRPRPPRRARSCSSSARELLAASRGRGRARARPGADQRAGRARAGGGGARGDRRARSSTWPAATGSRSRRCRRRWPRPTIGARRGSSSCARPTR